MRELVASAADWSEEVTDDPESGTPLERFLAEAALLSSAETVIGNEEGVTLMTLHTAKGLEWPVVVLTGLEHGLFPLARAEEQPDGLEEERRLCYVGSPAPRTSSTSPGRGRAAAAASSGRASRRASSRRFRPPSWRSGGRPRSGRRTGRRGQAGRRAAGQWRRGGRALERTRPSRRPAARRPAEDEASQDAPRYVKGERVRHRRFGSGTIRGLSGVGRDLKVSVAFDDEEVGEKQLLVAYAGLEREWESA